MKILKYIIIVVAILIAAFLAIGLVNPEVEYGHEITVRKSVEEAWAVAQDESKFPQWLDGFKSMELIEGEYGAVGSKYRILVNPQEGQPDFEMIETVVSKEEFDHVYMVFDSEMMDFEQTMRFEEADGGTTVTTESKVIGKSLPMRSMFAMMESFTGAFTTQEAKNIDALKVVIEENTTDYYPKAEPVVSDSLEVAVEEIVAEVVE